MNEQTHTEIQQDSQDLYEFEIKRYQELLENNPEYAHSRYGLTLVYSLPSEKTFEIMNQFGFESKESLDYYNKGAMECQKGNLKEALKNFEKAESLECEQPELFYNIAAIHEEEGNTAKAKEYYQKYIDRVEQYESIPRDLQQELDEVRDHVKEI